MDKKKVAISVGPIPARLDSVKFITNRFKGGLAVRTVQYLADAGFELTVVAWAFTANTELAETLERHPNVKEVVRVADVFEYYDWFVAHAKDYDAFVMAAAVANLTPVKPYEGKFPSHDYKPGDEFDVKFMIAPRAIDAIKPLNPRACLVGYKLFDSDTDEELVEIARHTLADAKANVIFANTPAQAKSHKLAVMSDGSVVECTFDQHMELIKRAIGQEYFHTVVQPLSEDEAADPDVREALATVKMFERTFEPGPDGKRYGTVAVPVRNHVEMFATTARGHSGPPVIVRTVNFDDREILATGKATLNAPALKAMLGSDDEHTIVHRHFSDMDGPIDVPGRDVAEIGFQFPGTDEEARRVMAMRAFDVILEEHHGYLRRLPIRGIDWERYHELFPEKYFGIPDGFQRTLQDFAMAETLEVGGNKRPVGKYSYDPYVTAETAVNLTWEEVRSRTFDLGFARNALNYLSMCEIRTLLANCRHFIANTFAEPPESVKIDKDEAAIRDPSRNAVRHTLRLPDDSVMRHWFFAYSAKDFEDLGLTVTPYGRNSIQVTKGL